MKFLHRALESKLNDYLDYFSVVAITGPRQSGKSTLITTILKQYRYVSFDSQANINLYYDDPEKFMRIYDDKVIFDEVQKVPEIFSAIKYAVDNDRENPGKYVLTGSRQFSLDKEIAESLAGRIGKLSLLPYEFGEMENQHQDESIFMGSFPELVQKKYKLFDDWYASYVETYIEKDLRQLSNIGNLREFQKLMQLLAADTGQQLNMSRYAKNLGVDVKTIGRWISILEASYIVFLLPPYYKNLGKRITKSPKIYFYDTGLVSHLCGVITKAIYEKGPLHGAIFENYIVMEQLKYELHRKTHAKLYYYRTSAGDEIDLIIDKRSSTTSIEIKTSETFSPRFLQTLTKFQDEFDTKYLVYQGESREYLEDFHIKNYKDYILQLGAEPEGGKTTTK